MARSKTLAAKNESPRMYGWLSGDLTGQGSAACADPCRMPSLIVSKQAANAKQLWGRLTF